MSPSEYYKEVRNRGDAENYRTAGFVRLCFESCCR